MGSIIPQKKTANNQGSGRSIFCGSPFSGFESKRMSGMLTNSSGSIAGLTCATTPKVHSDFHSSSSNDMS